MGRHQAYSHLHYRGPRGEEREKGVENVFDEIMAEKFPNLKKETQRKHRVPNKVNPYTATSRCIIIRAKVKERILKVAREKQESHTRKLP